MKVWAVRLSLALMLLAAGVWGWKTLFPGPEEVIRQRLARVARTASVEGSEGQLARLSSAQSLTSFFTPDVEITVDMPGHSVQTIQGRDELLQAAVMARSRGTALKLDLVDVSVTIAPDRQSAEAHFTGKARLASDRGIHAQEIKARFVKVDGDWLIKHVETVPTLR